MKEVKRANRARESCGRPDASRTIADSLSMISSLSVLLHYRTCILDRLHLHLQVTRVMVDEAPHLKRSSRLNELPSVGCPHPPRPASVTFQRCAFRVRTNLPDSLEILSEAASSVNCCREELEIVRGGRKEGTHELELKLARSWVDPSPLQSFTQAGPAAADCLDTGD